MKSVYDVHVAVEQPHGESDNDSLRKELENLGFSDDRLVWPTVFLVDSRKPEPHASPLIDMHMSKKCSSPDEVTSLEQVVDQILSASGVPSYWHSESVPPGFDVSLAGRGSMSDNLGFTFKPFLAEQREIIKQWDIHLSFKEDEVGRQLQNALRQQGFYYLLREKWPHGIVVTYAIYTIQGVNHPREGAELFRRMKEWLEQVRSPACDLKFEVTTAMQKYNDPKIVPPTIDRIEWL